MWFHVVRLNVTKEEKHRADQTQSWCGEGRSEEQAVSFTLVTVRMKQQEKTQHTETSSCKTPANSSRLCHVTQAHWSELMVPNDSISQCFGIYSIPINCPNQSINKLALFTTKGRYEALHLSCFDHGNISLHF